MCNPNNQSYNQKENHNRTKKERVCVPCWVTLFILGKLHHSFMVCSIEGVKIGCWNIVIQNPDVAKLWSLHSSRDISRVWDEQKRARVLIFAIILESHPNIAGAEGFRTVTFFPASHIGTNCGFLHSGNNQCSKNKWRLCLWSPSELKQCLPYWFAHIYSTNNLKPQSEQEGCIFLCLTI